MYLNSTTSASSVGYSGFCCYVCVACRNSPAFQGGSDEHREMLTQQPIPDSPTVTLTWHASKYKVHKLHQSYNLRQCSGAVWKSRWPSWAPVPNKPTVSVDVKQHSTNNVSDNASELVLPFLTQRASRDPPLREPALTIVHAVVGWLAATAFHARRFKTCPILSTGVACRLAAAKQRHVALRINTQGT